MATVTYCSRCILPDSRPGIFLDAEGVCSACRGHDDKMQGIDWEPRGRRFAEIVGEAQRDATGYDCIVPVSGGKDSWFQVIRCLEAGLRPLAVTWRTPGRTALGQQNLDAMVQQLGVDHIDYRIDPDVERRFMIAAYERKGATAIPMHMALFAIPITLAVRMRIPLLVWGENPQLEFGGLEDERLATDLDVEWVRRHGVTNQTTPEDWVGAEGLTERDLVPYRMPPRSEWDFTPRSIFLGAFFRWDSQENARVAQSRGFTPAEGSRTGVWSFADIDCRFISLHHYLKWFKFGMTRAFDNLSVDIRHGRLSRDEAVRQLRSVGLQTPHEDITAFCSFVGRPESWFWQVAERFRNPEIWQYRDGRWCIPGFLVEDWSWR